MTIPASSHPAPTIMKMLSHFAYLKDAGFEFPANVQAMIILCKLPPTMEVVAQILSQTSPSEIKTLKPDGIVKATTLSFEQKGASCGTGGKAPQANKLSTVKHKQADPKFAQQRQQQGGSNGSGSGNAPAQGQGGRNRCGGKKACTCHERTQNAEFVTYIHYEDGLVPTVDPRALAHTPGATNYGPPAFNNTIKAFDLAHCLGMEPSCQTIRTLDQVISTTSASQDQPEAGPSSLKRPHLKEHITMDMDENTISLGDEEERPFIYEDFTDSKFDNLDEMVLDRYNREIQSWPQLQLQLQLHVTSKLRHVYYPMLKVWSEHEYSVQKLSSSVDFQIMLMSCVQKKVLSAEGIYH